MGLVKTLSGNRRSTSDFEGTLEMERTAGYDVLNQPPFRRQTKVRCSGFGTMNVRKQENLDYDNDDQDFDEKRREWRKAKKHVIYAISEMNSRALKFECSERKMVALHAIQYYKVQNTHFLYLNCLTCVPIRANNLLL